MTTLTKTILVTQTTSTTTRNHNYYIIKYSIFNNNNKEFVDIPIVGNHSLKPLEIMPGNSINNSNNNMNGTAMSSVAGDGASQ